MDTQPAGTPHPHERYDAIVIGARCARSPMAMPLARKGYRILLLEKATLPSDGPRPI